ncbi:MAG: DUF882 domain-containing protein [Tabrizicola sp.]|nr:DUF882 domain-containing protein [Tabrizicola sp.]
MLTRRQWIGGIFAATLAAPGIVRAQASGVVGVNRLWVIRAWDGEQLDAPIRLRSDDGSRNAWMLWSYFWRDVKDDDQAVWIDMALLDRLSAAQILASGQRGEETPIVMNSGYRTVERNRTIEGAAPNSLHCIGKACDFNFRGLTPRQTADLLDAESRLSSGGLGRYDDFTHLDTGPRRRWDRT